MKKIFFKIIVFIFILFNIGCKPNVDDEGYEIYNVTGYHYEFVDYHKYPDGYYHEININNNDTVKFDYLEFRVLTDLELEKVIYGDCLTDSVNGYIKDIKLYSDTEYNNDFPISTNLNKLFYIVFDSNKNHMYDDTLILCEFKKQYLDARADYKLRLKTPPSDSRNFKFFFEIEFTDGRKYNFNTDTIFIIP